VIGMVPWGSPSHISEISIYAAGYLCRYQYAQLQPINGVERVGNVMIPFLSNEVRLVFQCSEFKHRPGHLTAYCRFEIKIYVERSRLKLFEKSLVLAPAKETPCRNRQGVLTDAISYCVFVCQSSWTGG
jgi:hypothetical protein